MAGNNDGAGEKKERTPPGLIPGLPDDIALIHIATKIPWSCMYTLSCVSGAWRRSIRNREVYDVRKRCGASQSMVVAPVERRHKRAQGFYDMKNGDLYVFPLIRLKHETDIDRPPGFERVLTTGSYPEGSTRPVPQAEGVVHRVFKRRRAAHDILFVDGKLYTFRKLIRVPQRKMMFEVHALDIGACDWKWSCRCTWDSCSLLCLMSGGAEPVWVAANEKIYLFHPCGEGSHGYGFDPKTDTWIEIESKPGNVPRPFYANPIPNEHRYRRQVVVLNQEIYVGGISEANMVVFDCRTEKWRTIPNTLQAGDAEIRLGNFGTRCSSMIVVKERLYYFCHSSIQVYNAESNSWTTLSGNFTKDFKEDSGIIPYLVAVVSYRSEVVALLQLPWSVTYGNDSQYKFCRSVGFGVEGKKFTWEEFPELSLDPETIYSNRRGVRILYDYLEL